jgi:transcription elongation factor GreA
VPLTAAELLRAVGLLPDGPAPWDRPVPDRGPGVFVVELPEPLARAPIELTRIGKWLERVPSLELDGRRPTSRALAARLAAFWLPSQVVLYVGATDRSIGARVAAMERTVLGDRRPNAGGHWLHVLTVLSSTRIWWAGTDAAEEYEDALLTAFAEAVEPSDVDAQAAIAGDRDVVVLPFANLRRPTGERRASGLTGALLAEAVVPPPPPTHVVELPDADADGARDAPAPTRPLVAKRRPAPPRPAPSTGAAAARRPSGRRGAATPPVLTAEGAERLRAELAELTGVRRPEVIARIKAAKELGDLRENADYTAAREEQSFLEGRIASLEARLRHAVIAAPPAGGGAGIGARVTVEVDGASTTYVLVGSAESDPGAGRLSIASPVGRALLGAAAGTVVEVETPRGRTTYRVVEVA